jgi:hypothetical protein
VGKTHNEELQNISFSPNIIRIKIKEAEIKNAYNILGEIS